jgi:hypothetical protein
MAEIKTTMNDGDVDAFINSVENDRRREDSQTVKEIMTRLSGDEPQMWGTSIVGFGPYVYTPPAGGKEREWFKIGFSPRKQSMVLYIMDGFKNYDTLLGDLGPHSTGKSCLYIKNVEKVDQNVLEQLITESLQAVEERVTPG